MASADMLPFETKTIQLDNGLRIAMVQQATPGLIAFYTLVRVGSRDEVEPGVSGFAHFFEHMYFRGTERFPPEKVQALLKQTGADQNGFTTDDFTCYTFFGSNAHLEELIDYESDRLQRLVYTEQDFKTEAGAVLGEYNKNASFPWMKLNERLRELTFKAHTYGHTTIGYLKDIEAMPGQYAYSKSFFERFYAADNVVLIVVGEFDPAQLESLVRKYYSGFTRKRAVTQTKPEPGQTAEIREKIGWNTPTVPMLSMSWRTPAVKLDSPESAVQEILFELLFGRIAAAYQELVLEQSLVEAFEDDTWSHRDPYLFHVIARVKDPAKMPAVEARIGKAVSDLAAGKISAQTLADVKSNVKYGLLLGLDSPPRIASTLAFTIGPTGDTDALEKLVARIEKVTPRDVQNFAKKYLTARNRAVVTLVQEAKP